MVSGARRPAAQGDHHSPQQRRAGIRAVPAQGDLPAHARADPRHRVHGARRPRLGTSQLRYHVLSTFMLLYL